MANETDKDNKDLPLPGHILHLAAVALKNFILYSFWLLKKTLYFIV